MNTSFKQFIFKPIQLIEIVVMLLVFVVLGVVIHSKYPLPFVFADTGAYVLSAYSDMFNIFRPMGYSHYLQLLHGIVPTLGFVFTATYSLYAIVSILLLFSAKYILEIKSEIIFVVMSLCAILSPRMLFACNFVMSDAIFVILATFLMVFSLWLVKTKKWWWVVLSFVVLWFMCKIRYSGLFFVPVIMVMLFLAYKDSKKKFVPYVLAVLPLFFVLVFYNNTKKEYFQQTKMNMFAGFSGWQKMNNAAVLFPEAKELEGKDFDGVDVRRFHSFLQSVPDSVFNDHNALSTVYMWNNELPFKQFMYASMQTSGRSYPEQWVKCGDLYARYADQVVAKYPFKYFTKYILPSIWSNINFYGFKHEYSPLKNEKMWQEYYGLEEEVYDQGVELFTATDPFRKVAQNVYWIASIAATVVFCCFIRRKNFQEVSFVCMFLLLSSFVIIIGAQAVSAPNATWRYTMQFYQTSIIFIFVCLDMLIQRIRLRQQTV